MSTLLALSSTGGACEGSILSSCWKTCIVAMQWIPVNDSTVYMFSTGSSTSPPSCPCSEMNFWLDLSPSMAKSSLVLPNPYFSISVVASDSIQMTFHDQHTTSINQTDCPLTYCVLNGKSILNTAFGGCLSFSTSSYDVSYYAYSYWWAIFIACLVLCCLVSCMCFMCGGCVICCCQGSDHTPSNPNDAAGQVLHRNGANPPSAAPPEPVATAIPMDNLYTQRLHQYQQQNPDDIPVAVEIVQPKSTVQLV